MTEPTRHVPQDSTSCRKCQPIHGAGTVLVLMMLAALIGSALNSIALCALYLYATEGKVPQAFANTGLQHAFATKKK